MTATEGSLLPSGAWKGALVHVDILAIGLGVLPFLLGAGWIYSSLRDEMPAVRSLAAFAGVTLPLLVLETASYDLRFGGEGVNGTRYLFYLAPLLLIASAAALRRPPIAGIRGRRSDRLLRGGRAVAGLPRVNGVALDSAEAVLYGVIRDVSPGLPPGVFVALCGAAARRDLPRVHAVARAGGDARRRPSRSSPSAEPTGYAFERLLSSHTAAGFPVTGQDRVRDWVDHAAEGRSVACSRTPSRATGGTARSPGGRPSSGTRP